MKRIVFLLFLPLCLLLTGCRGEEMERFFIVTAMAVDWEGEAYRLKLEGSADQVDENKNPKAVLREGWGKNLTQCFLDIQKQTGEYPYTRQTELILLSGAIPPEALGRLIDDLLNENGVRLNARVVMTGGRAGNLLEAGEFSGQRILKAVTKGGGTLTAADIMLRDLAFARAEQGIDPVLPLTDPIQTEGLCLLKNNIVSGQIEPALTPVFMMAGGTERGGSITVETAEGAMAFRLLRNKGKIVPRYENGHVTVRISIEGEFRAADRLARDTAFYEAVLKERLEADLQALLAVLQAARCDGLGFGRQLAVHHPKVWAMLEGDWDAHFSACRIEPDITVSITSTGKLKAG